MAQALLSLPFRESLSNRNVRIYLPSTIALFHTESIEPAQAAYASLPALLFENLG
jgi:hypothetical protein